MINISQKRIPFRIVGKYEVSYEYFIYDLSKKELGNWLNTWFQGSNHYAKTGEIFREELWTFKRVDQETANHLYLRKINAIALYTFAITGAKFPKNENGDILYNFKAQICSIDDSSYGMWFSNITLKRRDELKNHLIKWVNSQKEVNGKMWFKEGETLGADEFDLN